MKALWGKIWIAAYKREVRILYRDLEIHKEIISGLGYEFEEIKVNIHTLNGLHRGIIRSIQIKIAFWVAVFSMVAWIIGTLYHCPKFF